MINIESLTKLSVTALNLLQEIYDIYVTDIIFQKFNNDPYFPIYFDDFDSIENNIDLYSKSLYYLASKDFIRISTEFTPDNLPLHEGDTNILLTAKAIDFMESEEIFPKV